MVTENLWIPTLRKAISGYNREQKGPKVNLKVETLGRPQLHAKLLSAVGRGDAPDLALIDWAWVLCKKNPQHTELLLLEGGARGLP